jgi:UDP-GlcNAc:undecaprenyl-phosphate GlcNAc-1-phosphate transferase
MPMRDYVLTMLAAAAVTYLLTPLVRRFAIAIGAKHAARDRDVHVVPTPLLGGFAMYAGLAAGLVVASRLPILKSVFQQTNMSKGLLLAGGLIVIMGFVDDRWGMGAISKLAGQVAAGVILVWSGAEVTWLPEPNGGTLGLTSTQQTAATILVVVVTINAVNFIDGLDGLAAGIVGIGAAAFFIYYYTLTHRLGLPDQTGPALASAVLAGMCLGFLPHNFHPARIFMGDTGAMLIGLLLAYAPISSLASLDPGTLTNYASGGTVNRFGAIVPLLLPAAIMLIPYSDLLMAVVRRTRAGMSPFAPDKKHLHHRMLDIGHSHRTSVLIMYLWAALFTCSVVWLSIVRTPIVVLAIVTVAAMLVLLLVSMPRLRPWTRNGNGNGNGARAAGAVPVRVAPGREPSALATDAAPLPAGVRPAGVQAAGPARDHAAMPGPARVQSAVRASSPAPAATPSPGSPRLGSRPGSPPWAPAPPAPPASSAPPWPPVPPASSAQAAPSVPPWPPAPAPGSAPPAPPPSWSAIPPKG